MSNRINGLIIGNTIGWIVGILNGTIDLMINAFINGGLNGTVQPLICPIFAGFYGACYGFLIWPNEEYVPGVIFWPTILSMIGAAIGSYLTGAFGITNGVVYGQTIGALLGTIFIFKRKRKIRSRI